jgi:hypothetical protein
MDCDVWCVSPLGFLQIVSTDQEREYKKRSVMNPATAAMIPADTVNLYKTKKTTDVVTSNVFYSRNHGVILLGVYACFQVATGNARKAGLALGRNNMSHFARVRFEITQSVTVTLFLLEKTVGISRLEGDGQTSEIERVDLTTVTAQCVCEEQR